MSATSSTMGTALTESDLAKEGFTFSQIKGLVELRSVYPVLEYTDTAQEVRRLVWLKWMRAEGRLAD